MRPAFPSALEVMNTTGLSGLINILINTRVNRMTLVELSCREMRYHCGQLEDIINQVNGSRSPFTRVCLGVRSRICAGQAVRDPILQRFNF